MTDEKKKSLPWWGWAIIAVLGIGVISSLFGGDDETTPADSAIEEQVEQTEAEVVESDEASSVEVDWSKYGDGLQERIDSLAAAADCSALQSEFDTAFDNDELTRERTGSGNADLMAYIDDKLRAAGCYEASGSNDQSADEYDACSTNGNLFIIRAEDNCVDPWPLNSASGILYCDPFGEANDSIVYQPDEDPSVYYALNGSALASGYPDLDPIWLDNPDGTSPKVNLGELSAAALALCE